MMNNRTITVVILLNKLQFDLRSEYNT